MTLSDVLSPFLQQRMFQEAKSSPQARLSRGLSHRSEGLPGSLKHPRGGVRTGTVPFQPSVKSSEVNTELAGAPFGLKRCRPFKLLVETGAELT